MVDRPTAAASKESGSRPVARSCHQREVQDPGLIARGGMGKVYRAEQAPLGRICAIKVLNPNYTGEHDPEFHKRFLLEASMTSKLRHPNTVTIFDYGHTDDGIYYMAMEYLEGYTLHRAIRQVGHLPEERTAHVARQICRSLREAHRSGSFTGTQAGQRVSPRARRRARLRQGARLRPRQGRHVGQRRATQAGLFMGSPKYMAPEQVTGGVIDGRTDIYALGVIMYEMITGKVPFDRPKSLEILMAHVGDEIPPIRKMNPAARVSPAMEETIMRSMAKSPNDRFRSMDEVLAALKRLGGGAIAAEPSASMTADCQSATGSGPTASRIVLGAGAAMAVPLPEGAWRAPQVQGCPTIRETRRRWRPTFPSAKAILASSRRPSGCSRSSRASRSEDARRLRSQRRHRRRSGRASARRPGGRREPDLVEPRHTAVATTVEPRAPVAGGDVHAVSPVAAAPARPGPGPVAPAPMSVGFAASKPRPGAAFLRKPGCLRCETGRRLQPQLLL